MRKVHDFRDARMFSVDQSLRLACPLVSWVTALIPSFGVSHIIDVSVAQ